MFHVEQGIIKMIKNIWQFIAGFCSLPFIADLLIKQGKKRPYMHLKDYMGRWWLLPEYWGLPFSIRVHHILRADLEDYIHDHPGSFRTIILKGWYIEEDAEGKKEVRTAGYTGRANAERLHRIDEVSKGGVWTVFIMGKHFNRWGFIVPGSGEAPRKEYYKTVDFGDDRAELTPVYNPPEYTEADFQKKFLIAYKNCVTARAGKMFVQNVLPGTYDDWALEMKGQVLKKIDYVELAAALQGDYNGPDVPSDSFQLPFVDDSGEVVVPDFVDATVNLKDLIEFNDGEEFAEPLARKAEEVLSKTKITSYGGYSYTRPKKYSDLAEFVEMVAIENGFVIRPGYAWPADHKLYDFGLLDWLSSKYSVNEKWILSMGEETAVLNLVRLHGAELLNHFIGDLLEGDLHDYFYGEAKKLPAADAGIVDYA